MQERKIVLDLPENIAEKAKKLVIQFEESDIYLSGISNSEVEVFDLVPYVEFSQKDVTIIINDCNDNLLISKQIVFDNLISNFPVGINFKDSSN